MKLHVRKRRRAQNAATPPVNAYEGMSHAELAKVGRAAGFPPFCSTWHRDTLINKLMEANHAS